MTGSRRWFEYTSDTGNTFAVELDESNYESADLGFGAIAPGADGPLAQGRVLQVSATRPLTMRYVNCFFINNDNQKVTRSFYVGDPQADAFLNATPSIVVGNQTYSVTSSVGERRAGVALVDTGINDGDLDQNFEAGPLPG